MLGFVRDTLVARVFGAGMETDASPHSRFPTCCAACLQRAHFSQAFVPVLAEYKNKHGHDATQALVNHVATLLLLALLGITLLGVVAAPVVIYLGAPAFMQPAKFQLTVDMLRVIFTYILFISLVALAGGVLNTYSKFSVPAFTPVLLNLAFIFGTLVMAESFEPPIMALAWAVLLGGVIQLAFQMPHLAKIGLLPKFSLNLHDEGVWRILKLMGPAVFGVSIAQLSLLINTIFASFLVTGSVSWLYYADRLMEFPTGMLGVALGTILLPSLAKSHSNQDNTEYSRLLDWGLRLTLMLALPAVALAVLAVPRFPACSITGNSTKTMSG